MGLLFMWWVAGRACDMGGRWLSRQWSDCRAELDSGRRPQPDRAAVSLGLLCSQEESQHFLRRHTRSDLRLCFSLLFVFFLVFLPPPPTRLYCPHTRLWFRPGLLCHSIPIVIVTFNYSFVWAPTSPIRTPAGYEGSPRYKLDIREEGSLR